MALSRVSASALADSWACAKIAPSMGCSLLLLAPRPPRDAAVVRFVSADDGERQCADRPSFDTPTCGALTLPSTSPRSLRGPPRPAAAPARRGAARSAP